MRLEGVQYAGAKEWMSLKPRNMIGIRPMPEDQNVDPLVTLPEVFLTNNP